MKDLSELPLGFSMALRQNKKAMQFFNSLTEQEQKNIIGYTPRIHSNKEMQSFLDSLPEI